MIEVENISFSYANKVVIENISFKLKLGECVGVLGNNGAGKSTLITCLNKICTPKTGQLYINGENALTMSRQKIAKCISYVAQKNELTQMTVFDTVLLGRKPYIKWSVTQEDINICDDMIDQLGMTSFKLRYINELSGGELQKIMLARALVQQPKLLLLDEPTSNLDPKNQHEMLALVRELAKKHNIGVLLVIHDLNLALRYCDKFLFIKEGQIYRYGDEKIITEDTIFNVYDVKSVITKVNGRKLVVIE